MGFPICSSKTYFMYSFRYCKVKVKSLILKIAWKLDDCIKMC